MRFLYPASPLNPKTVEPTFQAEYTQLKNAGQACHLFSETELAQGRLKPYPKLPKNSTVIYRGWMMTPTEYTTLHHQIQTQNAKMLTSPKAYQHCHYLPEWYAPCKAWTPETIWVPTDHDFDALLQELNWGRYFIKDYVKSLSTGRGSVAETGEDVREIIQLLEQYRGRVEGGVCIRKWEDLKPASETRFFVYQGMPYGPGEEVPSLVYEIAQIIPSPFYAVDIVWNSENQPRLIELGDGQVSDTKAWNVSDFAAIFSKAIASA